MKLRIATRLMLAAAVGVTALVCVLGVAAYLVGRKSLEQDIASHLESVAQSRAAHVETFLRTHKHMVAVAATSWVLADGLQDLRAGPQERTSVVEGLNARLAHFAKAEPDVYQLFLLNRDGSIVSSTSAEHIGMDKSADAYFVGARDDGFIKDVYRSESTGRVGFAVSAPIFDSDGGEFLGVLVARLDMTDLNSIVEDHTGLGRTGETYLVNKYGFLITPARFVEDGPLERKLVTESVCHLLADVEGMRWGTLAKEHHHEAEVSDDYRGVSALSVHAHILEMDWGLLAQVDTEEAFGPIARLGKALLGCGVLFLAAALAAAHFFARHICRPILQLQTGSQRIGNGELGYRLNINSGDEIEQLADEFNRMAARLSESYASLEQKVADRTAHLEREITERKRAEEQVERYAERLEALNAELERSNRDLHEFTYTVSHDLQEPLRKINAFGQFLMEDCGDQVSEQGREHLKRMQDAALRMKELIQHLLALARVGTRGGEPVPVETAQVIEEVLDTLSQQVRDCNAEVVVQEGLPAVHGDVVQLGQVFQNLIANALKFGSPERTPRVTISARVQGNEATFSVADNGIGIEERHLERVFGIFQRLHSPEQYEGAGVGLALCAKIIQRHGGRIWAESEVGKGTTFRFALSLHPTGRRKDSEQ